MKITTFVNEVDEDRMWQLLNDRMVCVYGGDEELVGVGRVRSVNTKGLSIFIPWDKVAGITVTDNTPGD